MLFVGRLQVSRRYLNLLEVPIKCKLLEAGTGGTLRSQLDSAVSQPRHLACILDPIETTHFDLFQFYVI